MSYRDRIEYSYSTDVSEVRRFSDHKPAVHVRLTEQITTTTRHDDGSLTTHETKPRVVESWVHQPEQGDDE
jgi:hypothetical protein